MSELFFASQYRAGQKRVLLVCSRADVDRSLDLAHALRERGYWTDSFGMSAGDGLQANVMLHTKSFLADSTCMSILQGAIDSQGFSPLVILCLDDAPMTFIGRDLALVDAKGVASARLAEEIDRIVGPLMPMLSDSPEEPAKPYRSRQTIFIAHVKEDEESANWMAWQLRRHQFRPWIDESGLRPGDAWKEVITETIRNSAAVMVCLSRRSIAKRDGFFHEEIRIACEVAREQQTGTHFIFPVKIEECQVPQVLKEWHWTSGIKCGDLLDALDKRLASIAARP